MASRGLETILLASSSISAKHEYKKVTVRLCHDLKLSLNVLNQHYTNLWQSKQLMMGFDKKNECQALFASIDFVLQEAFEFIQKQKYITEASRSTHAEIIRIRSEADKKSFNLHQWTLLLGRKYHECFVRNYV